MVSRSPAPRQPRLVGSRGRSSGDKDEGKASEGGVSPSSRVGPQHHVRGAEIIEIATRLFAEKGYEATSIQDLGEALGILKASVYYYINSKEDLLFQIMEEMHKDIWTSLADARLREGTVLDQLHQLIEDMVYMITRNYERAAVFHNDFKSLSEEHRNMVIAIRDEYESFVRDLVSHGQRMGEIRSDIDAKLVVFGIFSMVNLTYTWYRPEQAMTPSDIARGYSALLIDGLRAG